MYSHPSLVAEQARLARAHFEESHDDDPLAADRQRIDSEVQQVASKRAADERAAIVTALKAEHQVGSGVYYPIPNHRLASLRHFAPDLDLPTTEHAAREVISLPVHPSLTPEDLERIVTGVTDVMKAGA